MGWKDASDGGKYKQGHDEHGNYKSEKLTDFGKGGKHDHEWSKSSPSGEHKEGWIGKLFRK